MMLELPLWHHGWFQNVTFERITFWSGAKTTILCLWHGNKVHGNNTTWLCYSTPESSVSHSSLILSNPLILTPLSEWEWESERVAEEEVSLVSSPCEREWELEQRGRGQSVRGGVLPETTQWLNRSASPCSCWTCAVHVYKDWGDDSGVGHIVNSCVMAFTCRLQV